MIIRDAYIITVGDQSIEAKFPEDVIEGCFIINVPNRDDVDAALAPLIAAAKKRVMREVGLM